MEQPTTTLQEKAVRFLEALARSSNANPMDQIIPNLWVGDCIAAGDKDLLLQHGIKYVLSATQGVQVDQVNSSLLFFPSDILRCISYHELKENFPSPSFTTDVISSTTKTAIS